MGFNEVSLGNRVHIGFFGCRNAGKSSLVNAVTMQDVAVVSDIKGTTTDPVSKSMELLPIGPVVIIDTPGFDDVGSLGELRVKQTNKILNKTDIAILVVDASVGFNRYDEKLVEIFKNKEIPYIVAFNKCDTIDTLKLLNDNEIYVSSVLGYGMTELKERIGRLYNNDIDSKKIVGDLIRPGEYVILVVPIDSSAPKGRLILPQQQTIRDILDVGAIPIVTRDTEFAEAIKSLNVKPALVVTDSQVFGRVSKETPDDVLLTSFSILMARYKGLLDSAIDGVCAIDNLKNGDTVLISEGCTHHRQCDDIGTVKIPKWLKDYTGLDINIETTSGGGFPDDLSKYSLIIHCGSCMLNEREMRYRIKCAKDSGVPITNYGIAIAYFNGILKRSIEIFPSLADKIK